MSPRKRGNPMSRPYRVAFLGTMALVTALIIFMYATTFKTGTQGTILSAVMLLVAGLLFAWVMVGVKFEPFEMRDLVESILWTGLSFGAIWIVNRAVPFNLEVAVLVPKTFSVLMGVAEESFFRLWLTTFIAKVTRSTLLAIGVSSAIWTVYHIARYGGDMGAFFVIFMAGLVLGYVMLRSKMADGVMFAHAMVNFMATP